MPHAVDTSDVQGQQDDVEIARILDGTGAGAAGRPDQSLDFLNRDLEVGEKADDAQDFEDIDDDDLASDEDEAPATINTGPALAIENQDHDDLNFEDDLFGEDDDGPPAHDDDIFATAVKQEEVSTEELGSRSVIALPGVRHRPATADQTRPDPEDASLSPSELEEPATDSATPERRLDGLDDLDEEDPLALMQRRLFARQYDEGPETKMESFYDTWPSFEPDQVPRFMELFPPLPSQFNWKAPGKPPKPLQPTKLTLEIAADAERSFRSTVVPNSNRTQQAAELQARGMILCEAPGRDVDEESNDSLGLNDFDENEAVGGVSWEDMKLACLDFDVASQGASSDTDSQMEIDEWDIEGLRPAKRRKVDFDIHKAAALRPLAGNFDDPERSTGQVASKVVLDRNDPDLLFEDTADMAQIKSARFFEDAKPGLRNPHVKALLARYNISNDQEYDLLKENHQHKVRSMIGNVAIEHSLPAARLQFPFYQVKLPAKQLRSFHRPKFHGVRIGRENKFNKPKTLKRKHIRGKEAKEIFQTTEDLSMGDNSNGMLLEYSEEMPMMLSNFGMGNRVVNYYRRKDDEDTARPKEDIGETQVLLPQDRSPFAIFGHVNPGEIVPTIYNSMYRAPIFRHQAKQTDFVVVTNTNAAHGVRFYIRNIENLHSVGQQLPSKEVPGERAKPVSDAAKRRLQALSFRIWKKWTSGHGPPLTNKLIQEHLPGSDIPANRTKMHEFMAYEKMQSFWMPKENENVPTSQEIRSWIKPDDLCLIESTQVGLQHLSDLGLAGNDDINLDDESKEESNIDLLLAPWLATKNFLNACQSKAMLKLHGPGDPTGRGEGISFVKTSMKGGFRALGESIEERLDAKRLKENNGHSYNVAKQQRAYEESIRRIWNAQKDSLSSTIEHSDNEGDLYDDAELDGVDTGATPAASHAGTPAPFSRREDESASQFSRTSTARKAQTLVITRMQKDKYGKMQEVPVTVTNQRVIAAYKRAKYKEQSAKIECVHRIHRAIVLTLSEYLRDWCHWRRRVRCHAIQTVCSP